MKVALVAPAGTVTLAGTVAAAVLLLISCTTAPPAGAAVFSVAVPVALAAAGHAAGADGDRLQAGRDHRHHAGGVAGAGDARRDRHRGVGVGGRRGGDRNVALLAPAGMVTLAGMVAALTLKSLVICSVTVVPPAGDGPDRSTVPVEPPVP